MNTQYQSLEELLDAMLPPATVMLLKHNTWRDRVCNMQRMTSILTPATLISRDIMMIQRKRYANMVLNDICQN